MKRYLAAILILALLLGLSACSAAGAEESPASSLEMSQPGGEAQTAETEKETASAEGPAESSSGETESASEGETPAEPGIDWDAIECQPAEYELGDWDDADKVYFGPNGERVTIPARPVKDVFTGEARYYLVSYASIARLVGRVAEEDLYQLLFDARGNLLETKLQGPVECAAGDYLVRRYFQDGNADCGLWDPEQGRYAADDIGMLARIDEDTALVIDGSGIIRGTMDRETLSVSRADLDADLSLQEVRAGLIFALEWDSDGEPPLVVLDESLKPVYRSDQDGYYQPDLIYDFGGDGKVFCVSDRLYGRILRVKDGEAEVIFEYQNGGMMNLFLIHCDRYRLVIREEGSSYLCDYSGEKLTEAYDSMGCLVPEDGSGSGRFAAVTEKTIYVLDADGKVLDQREIPGLMEVSYEGGAIVYVTRNESDPGGSYCGSNYVTGLMDGFFSDMIVPVKAAYISTMLIGAGPDYVWIVAKEAKGGRQYDVYDSALRPIALGASLVGTVTERGIALQKGFSRGVMGFDGKWITEYSIYEDEWRD
ncbi:MAG: hypothetical protein J5865_06115 [Lachnospiraceae bacterium]|nr:hypothetical protein [Lachnospiraceae bacterium]